MLELRPLTDRQLHSVYYTYMTVDFPPSERRHLASIRRLRRTGYYDTWGVFEGEELLAYTFLWRTPEGNCALLDYQSDIFEVRYAMLAWPGALPLSGAELQKAHRGLYQSHMPPLLFRWMIHIPAAHCGKKE